MAELAQVTMLAVILTSPAKFDGTTQKVGWSGEVPEGIYNDLVRLGAVAPDAVPARPAPELIAEERATLITKAVQEEVAADPDRADQPTVVKIKMRSGLKDVRADEITTAFESLNKE